MQHKLQILASHIDIDSLQFPRLIPIRGVVVQAEVAQLAEEQRGSLWVNQALYVHLTHVELLLHARRVGQYFDAGGNFALVNQKLHLLDVDHRWEL